MNVTCQNCKTKLSIPDDKISKNKESAFKCPKCKEKILIPVAGQFENVEEKETSPIHAGLNERLSALVCIGDAGLRKKVYPLFQKMGVSAEAVPKTQAALKRMEYHIYHIVIIDDAFDGDKGFEDIIERMNTIDMSLRRRICLVWINNIFKTNDSMMALNASVNNIFHVDDILHLESFLEKTLLEHKNFYTVYTESLKQAGRA